MASNAKTTVTTLIASPVRAVRHVAAWFKWHASGEALMSGRTDSGEVRQKQHKAA